MDYITGRFLKQIIQFIVREEKNLNLKPLLITVTV